MLFAFSSFCDHGSCLFKMKLELDRKLPKFSGCLMNRPCESKSAYIYNILVTMFFVRTPCFYQTSILMHTVGILTQKQHFRYFSHLTFARYTLKAVIRLHGCTG